MKCCSENDVTLNTCQVSYMMNLRLKILKLIELKVMNSMQQESCQLDVYRGNYDRFIVVV